MNIDTKIKNGAWCPECGYKSVFKYDGFSIVRCDRCGFAHGGLDHVHFINEQIAIGNGSVPFDKVALGLLGIEYILSVANDFPGDEFAGQEIHLPNCKIPLHDSKNNTVEMYKDAINDINYIDGHYNKFLVHCMGGGRRSVSVVAFYLSRGNKKKYWKIIKKFKKVRSAVRLGEGIHDFVIENNLLS